MPRIRKKCRQWSVSAKERRHAGDDIGLCRGAQEGRADADVNGRREQHEVGHRARLQDGRHYAAGGAVQGAPRASDRAAAHFGQRRVPAKALCEGAGLRSGHGAPGTASARSTRRSGFLRPRHPRNQRHCG
jgi:hypothetical protein